MKPDFIGLGVQKAGTSWIHAVLRSHPDIELIATDNDKDSRFFSHFYDHGYEWYEQYYSGFNPLAVKGEFSTSYFYNSDAPARLKSYCPDAKLMVCLRDPVDRILSNHRHEIRLGHISAKNYAIEAGVKNNPMYIEQSRYYTHLEKWLEHFSAEQIQVIIYEDIQDDSAAFAKKMYAFLGVDAAYKPANLEDTVNESRVIKSQKIRLIKKAISRIGRTIGLGAVLDKGKALGVQGVINKANSDTSSIASVTMSDEYRVSLKQHFIEENNKLADYLGRDLDCWK